MQKQNKVVQEMTLQQYTKDQIEKSLHRKFGEQSKKSSTIYQKKRLVRCGQDITQDRQYHSDHIDQQLSMAIQNVIDEYQFSSVRSIARDLNTIFNNTPLFNRSIAFEIQVNSLAPPYPFRYAFFEEWKNRCDFIRNNNGIYYK